MGELVEHVEHPILACIVGPILDEVIGPDMIALLRPQPNARSVGQPEPAALGLLMGNLQPLTSPDPLDPLVVDCPACLAQQLGDLAIAIAAVLPGKLDNIGGETPLVLTTARDLALRRAMLPERRTGATLGDMQLRSDLLNAGTATRGA
jgi:hypothetical protein